MSWTDLTDPQLSPGKFVPTDTMLALRDNPVAIANGDAGAPKIQNAAMDTNSIDNDNVVNGALGAEKLQAGTTETDWVLGRIAGLSAGAVGTPVLGTTDEINTFFGDLISGIEITPSNASGTSGSGTLSGTWRCCGRVGAGTGEGARTTLFVRTF